MVNDETPGRKVVGYGWTGTFRGRSKHRLGFLMPHFVSHNDSEPLSVDQKKALGRIANFQFAPADMWRVKITIEAVKDKRGRYIVKRYKKPSRRKP